MGLNASVMSDFIVVKSSVVQRRIDEQSMVERTTA